ncbi:MAG TPA: hypothetical protein DDY68_00170, partial [Porphyromonadaceae bacterium]|nr:hypothetical protein [Porphyromonadaceae bacterium]
MFKKLFSEGMKLGLLICSVIGLLGFCGTGCTNDAGTLGATTYPEGDDVRVMRDTLNVEVTSCAVEKVFSKLPYGALGVVTDALWGTTSVDFMAQFYYPEGFSFPSTIVKNDGNKDYNGINSVGLRLYYSTISGTASKSMTIKVYECDKKSLDASERYTN